MKQNMEIISMDVKAFDALAGHVEAIERKAEALCRRQEDVSLKKWLDNQDVCDVLGISKRTLQTYREKGLLPFSRIRHKIFYKPEDVGKLLQSSHYLLLTTDFHTALRGMKKREEKVMGEKRGENDMP